LDRIIQRDTGKNKIAFISQPEYFRFAYENALDSIAEVREFKMEFSFQEKDYTSLIKFDPDIAFFFRGEFIPGKVLESLRGLKINLSSEPFPRVIQNKTVFTKDSLLRYLNFRQIRKKKFDYIFHYDAASLSFLAKDGLNLSGAFAFPVSTSVYKPVEHKKLWDLFFVGRSTNHREVFFGPLKHTYEFLHIAHGIWGQPLVDYIGKSKICLNIHAENEISWEPRIQMLLACGAFVISEPITPNDFLRPNIDFIEIVSKDDLIEKVSHFLRHPEEAELIASSGLNRVREVLDAKTKFIDLIDKIRLQEVQPFLPNKTRSDLDILTFAYNKIYRFLK
jgi:hypothetical protein